MAVTAHGYLRQLFDGVSGPAISDTFAWPGGRLEVIGHATIFGGIGLSIELQAPDGVFVPGNILFLNTNGTTSGILCPCQFRAVLGAGAQDVSAWIVAVPNS